MGLFPNHSGMVNPANPNDSPAIVYKTISLMFGCVTALDSIHRHQKKPSRFEDMLPLLSSTTDANQRITFFIFYLNISGLPLVLTYCFPEGESLVL